MEIKKGDTIKYNGPIGHIYFKVTDSKVENNMLMITGREIQRVEICDGDCSSCSL